MPAETFIDPHRGVIKPDLSQTASSRLFGLVMISKPAGTRFFRDLGGHLV
jgi:hypothetical protein